MHGKWPIRYVYYLNQRNTSPTSLSLNLGPIWMGACSFKLEPVVAATTATDSDVLNLRLKIIHLVIDIYWYKSETINLHTVSNRAGPASTIVYNTTSCQVRTDSIIRTV